MMNLTPQEAAEKYTKSDGTIEIPGDVIIVMPKKTSALESIAKATSGLKKQTAGSDFSYKDGKIYVDGEEVNIAPEGMVVDKTNRAKRRAKKK
jgi:hypothetical protein